MQAFPVANLHAHAQPLFAYLRLLGVEPTTSGSLRIGKGARYESARLRLEADGSGALQTLGSVTLETVNGAVQRDAAGEVVF
jgi:hypothetical protein